MFELSVAFKYLLPRWRQLSVSIISLISILVISLVVWLIVVFFSVTNGLESTWVNKLIALTAPVRVVPTDSYYKSYYHLIDGISQNGDFTTKSIGEKLGSLQTNPYNPEYDQEIPPHWPLPDADKQGKLKDLVKLAFQAVQSVEGATAREFETTVANLRLKLSMPDRDAGSEDKQTLSHPTYLSAYDATNPHLSKTLYPITSLDLTNMIRASGMDGDTNPKAMRQRLQEVMQTIKIESLKTPLLGWMIPPETLPETCKLNVCVLGNNVLIPQDASSVSDGTTLVRDKGELALIDAQGTHTPLSGALIVAGNLSAEVVNTLPFNKLEHPQDIAFEVALSVQGVPLKGEATLNQWQVERFSITPLLLMNKELPPSLPNTLHWGEAILLPKGWRESGALIGDRGYLSYQTPTASSLQEQRIPIYVAGFFDPGILPMGGKVVLANPQIVSMIRSASPTNDSALANGINVRINDLEQADFVKKQIVSALQEAGIDRYWKVETYREFEFTKDFLQQFRSEKNLFSLISMVIIIVACSNIVSMLIILVNDKKMEIGILRSMGATSQSIAFIFGLCGLIMGLLGSLLGIGLALFTLRHLQTLIDFISRAQGFEMFNPNFFGETLPNEVSLEALGFVLTATVLISLIAGIVPAVKACLLRPSAILRSE